MTLHPAQKLIVKDSHRFRVVRCGRRFGKTTLAVVEMVGKACSANDLHIDYVAPTYDQARDIAWLMLKKTASGAIINANDQRLELTVRTKDNGTSLIKLRSWESIENLRGQKCDFLVLDEISSYRNFWVGWYEVLRPTLTDTKGHGLFISTPKGYNHFYDLGQVELTDPDFKSFHFTSYDNPFIPKEEIDTASKQLPEDQFAQEYMADYRKMTGLVYREFDRKRHLFEDEPTRITNTVAGLDWGYTNPAAIVTVKVDSDNTYWVTDEWYKTGRTDVQITDYVSSCAYNKVYPDPENPAAIQLLHDKHISVAEVKKGKDSIIRGINQLRELFKNNRIKIHKSCLNLISELETYRFPEKKPDKNDPELPVKEHDHALDALRYVLTGIQPNEGAIITQIKQRFITSEARFHNEVNSTK